MSALDSTDNDLIWKKPSSGTYPTSLSATQNLFAKLPRDKTILPMPRLNPMEDRSEKMVTCANDFKLQALVHPIIRPNSNALGTLCLVPTMDFSQTVRYDLSLLAQFLLDPWRSRQYLYRIQQHTSPLCRTCLYQPESRSHILQCPFTQSIRRLALPNSPTLPTLCANLKHRSTLRSLAQFLKNIYPQLDSHGSIALGKTKNYQLVPASRDCQAP